MTMTDAFIWAGIIGLFGGCMLACIVAGAAYEKFASPCRCRDCEENDENGRG